MIINDNGNTRGICFETPFKNELDGYGMTGNIISSASCACQTVHGRADTAAVYADFEVILSVTAFSVSDEEIIDKVALDKASKFDPMSRPPILIYYPHRGESLWEIAKKYSTTVNALRDVNHIQGDTSPDDSVMIIPRHSSPERTQKNNAEQSLQNVFSQNVCMKQKVCLTIRHADFLMCSERIYNHKSEPGQMPGSLF